MSNRLTKVQAADRLGISTKTLDRRIARGEFKTEREGGGRRRVLVIMDSTSDNDLDTLDSVSDTDQDTSDNRSDVVQDVSKTNGAGESQPEVPALKNRIAELEALHEFDKERLVLADERIQDLRQMVQSSQQTIDRLTLALPAPQPPPHRPWWRLWGVRSERE